VARLSYNADSNRTRVVAKASVVVARISTRLASDKKVRGSVTDAFKIRSNATDHGERIRRISTFALMKSLIRTARRIIM
jgi:hypothetical protein